MRVACRQFLPKLSLISKDKTAIIKNVNFHISRAGSITSNRVHLITKRTYSDQPYRQEGPSLPPLMTFPEITWPSVLQSLKNFIFANFLIKPQFDNDFKMTEFVDGSKQAVEVVSHALRDGDFQSLDGLVVPETIAELRTSVNKLSMAQREQLAVKKEDIYFHFPYQIGVIYEETEKRWVEITMCYHVLKGFKELMEDRDAIPQGMSHAGFQEGYKDQMSILNYRFVREFTKGVEDSWQLNIVNHFKPVDKMKD